MTDGFFSCLYLEEKRVYQPYGSRWSKALALAGQNCEMIRDEFFEAFLKSCYYELHDTDVSAQKPILVHLQLSLEGNESKGKRETEREFVQVAILEAQSRNASIEACV